MNKSKLRIGKCLKNGRRHNQCGSFSVHKFIITIAIALAVLTVASLAYFASLAYAEKLSIDTGGLIKRGSELGATDTANSGRKPETSDEIKKQIEEARRALNETAIPLSEKMRDMVTFDEDTGRFIFLDKPIPEQEGIQTAENGNDDELGTLGAEERLYIFVSSSMPMSLLKKYCEDMDAFKLGKNAVFVIRGCVPTGGGFNGCKDFKPTIEFVRSIMMKDDKTAYPCRVWIDPVLFNTYQVEEVPAFVYANGVKRSVELGSEGDYERLDAVPTWQKTTGEKSTGDWSLEYHLRELSKQKGAENLKKLLGDE